MVESQDSAERWAISEEFRTAGFDVASCGGPYSLAAGSCLLVVDGICPTAAGADVIFHRFDVADPAHEEILVALKRTYPGKPIVVEIAEPAFKEHSALLDGCYVIFMPAMPAAMVAGIRRAFRA